MRRVRGGGGGCRGGCFDDDDDDCGDEVTMMTMWWRCSSMLQECQPCARALIGWTLAMASAMPSSYSRRVSLTHWKPKSSVTWTALNSPRYRTLTPSHACSSFCETRRSVTIAVLRTNLCSRFIGVISGGTGHQIQFQLGCSLDTRLTALSILPS